MPRVFSAIEIENPEVLNTVEEIRNETDLGFRPVPTEKMHITLQFFKEVDEEELSQIKKAVQEVEHETFNAEIRGLGTFPSEDYIKVIWAGIESDEVFNLKKQVSDHEVASSSNHGFTPHITLHRVVHLEKEEKQKIQEKLEKYRGQKIADIEVNKVKLFESIMEEDGTRYREIEVKELK